MIPGAAGLISCLPYYRSKNPIEWWNAVKRIAFLQSCKKPEWTPKSLHTYAGMNLLTVTPAGYASYLVFKYGGGFKNELRNITLALYGSSLVLSYASLSLMQKKDVKAVSNVIIN
uniref:HIG1 domain-containing protein n=1 Tax=Setaria digitata TaxID=48799 RepID=A0A915PNT3_9BILA